MLLKDNIPFRYIFSGIRREVFMITLYVTIICLAQYALHLKVSIPVSVPMILGTIISLLLAFRANQAYDRWWEARIVWGGIVNDSRSWSRQVVSYIDNGYDDDEKAELEQRLINRQIAWAHCLGRALRGQSDEKQLGKWLHENDMNFIARYSSTPMALLELQARDIKYALDNGWINAYQHVELDRTLTNFSDHMGKCERIKKTVFPATYGLYLHLAMNLFIMLLPFALIEYFGWLMIPLVTAIASAFWLIEKMSVHLQDPFENRPTDTPVTAIAQTIERDLGQVLRQHNLSHAAENRVEQFYVL
ncbi:bestrophin family protein [Taibaiella koreensis]|uniref:bestrophin family protein n=1 Tax=Taibaiella koreensis TaxID=1268548 RepID=UPI000E59B1F4|nr:bestrophin family ion channel [Taibaiella koreensis]